MKRILITNDDGITAPGILAIASVIKDIGEITIVAPDREKSATGHSITVHSPLLVDEVEIPGVEGGAWAVDGTPADCVKLAIQTLMKHPPDIVVSGINRGANLGTDVLYSGTVSAAIEGIINGVPSVAISLNQYDNADFTYAAKFGKKLIAQLLQQGITVDTLINVNIPGIPEDKIKGVSVTKLGIRKYSNLFERRTDPRGKDYFWMGGVVVDVDNDEDSDVEAIKRQEIAVTPIHFDLTNYRIMNEVKAWNLAP